MPQQQAYGCNCQSNELAHVSNADTVTHYDASLQAFGYRLVCQGALLCVSQLVSLPSRHQAVLQLGSEF